MSNEAAERRLRRLERRIAEAVEDHGPNVVLEVFEVTLDALQGGGGRRSTPAVATREPDVDPDADPVVAARQRAEASRVRVQEARQARKRELREARANADGPATKRGRPPAIVLRDED